MSNTQATREAVKFEIEDLKNHPRQPDFFRGLADAELGKLANDMKQNGFRTPIEVLPDGTIITGHQRVRAARMLKWNSIDAVVRYDLDEQGEAAVVDLLIKDNLYRQQLDPLSQARCYKGLKENANKLPRERRKEYQGIDLRDRLAKKFGMSGRNLDRYVRLLSTPIEIQHAVSTNKLSLKAAGDVAGALQEVQDEIAAEIQEGVDPEQVVKKYLPKAPTKKMLDSNALISFFRRLRTDVPDLEARFDELRPLDAKDLVLLRRTQSLVDRLLKRHGGQEGEERVPRADDGSPESVALNVDGIQQSGQCVRTTVYLASVKTG